MSKSGMPNIQYPELGGTAPPMEEMKMDQAPYPPPPPYNESYQSQSVPMLQPQPITTTTIGMFHNRRKNIFSGSEKNGF